MTYCIILTTCPNNEEAEALALKILEEKLAACVQLSAITSFYHWKGKTCQEPEIRLLIKTEESLYKNLEEFILRNHSYEIPQIVQIPITNGSDAYLGWIYENTIKPS